MLTPSDFKGLAKDDEEKYFRWNWCCWVEYVIF